MKMPFGKHKGVNIQNLNPSYIIWLMDNIQLKEPLKSAIEKRYLDNDVKNRLNQIYLWNNYDDPRDSFYPEYF